MKEEKKPEWIGQGVNEELINKGIKSLKEPGAGEDIKNPQLLIDVLEMLKGKTNEELTEVFSMVYTILPEEAQEAIGYVLAPAEAKAAMLVARLGKTIGMN